VAAGDVKRDGKLDILAGDVWYAAPKWEMHAVRPVGSFDGAKQYSSCFYNFATDVKGKAEFVPGCESPLLVADREAPQGRFDIAQGGARRNPGSTLPPQPQP